MNVSAIHAAPNSPTGAGSALIDSQRAFSGVLARASAPTDAAQLAQESARSLIGLALVKPFLASWRASENAAPPFAPNAAEKQFRALQDSLLAQRITASTRWPLVERTARSLQKRLDGGRERQDGHG